MNSKHLYLSLLGLALAGPSLAGEAIDERRDLADDGRVSVSNVAGLIEIETWSKSEVHLTGELGSGSELKISETANGIRIEIESESEGRWGNDHNETDLHLNVPAGASISAEGVSADIVVTGTRGKEVRAESVSGDVEIEGEVQKLDLSSVSGDVSFVGTSPRTTVETVSGDVELEGVSGELAASGVSGDITVIGGVFSRGKFESVSGSLELELEVADGGRLTVESMSGDANVYLPSGQSGEIRAQTFSGDIDSEFGSAQSEDRGPGSKLKYSSGNGGASIRVESFSGDIEIGHK